jgi:hypothetical protein
MANTLRIRICTVSFHLAMRSGHLSCSRNGKSKIKNYIKCYATPNVRSLAYQEPNLFVHLILKTTTYFPGLLTPKSNSWDWNIWREFVGQWCQLHHPSWVHGSMSKFVLVLSKISVVYRIPFEPNQFQRSFSDKLITHLSHALLFLYPMPLPITSCWCNICLGLKQARFITFWKMQSKQVYIFRRSRWRYAQRRRYRPRTDKEHHMMSKFDSIN